MAKRVPDKNVMTGVPAVQMARAPHAIVDVPFREGNCSPGWRAVA
jgi:hypothetical protein